MKQKRRVFSLLLAFVLIAVYVLPSTGVLHASSLSDYTNVTTFVDNNFPVSTQTSQGVQFATGSQYLTVTTTDAYDPYFTVDLKDVSLSGKFISIKFKATADSRIANGYIYPESSAGGWGPNGAGMLPTSEMVCDGTWNVTTYEVSKQLVADGTTATVAQKSATIYTLRVGGVAKVGAKLQIAYIGVFDSAIQAEKYDELFCATYTSVKLDKTIIIPQVFRSIKSEFYDFQEDAVTNDLKLIGNNTNVRIDWVAKEGANGSRFVVDGSNKYLKLNFDSLAHGELYSNDVSYFFSADIKPEDKANHFAGFIFNYAQENAWKENKFFETNGTDGENCVSSSGIGVNIFPYMIIVYVVCYDQDTGNLKRIEYRHPLSENIGDRFHNFKAIDDANGTIRFLLDNEIFAYVEYSNPGSMPVSAKKHFECYYRTAKIYNADGGLEASATDAMVAYIKSLAAGSRARTIYLDNLEFKSLGSVLPSVSLDKDSYSELDTINAKVNYGDYLVDDLYLGIYNKGEECTGLGRVSPSYKIELDKQRNVKLPKLVHGDYYAVIMSGSTQYSEKVDFKVTDVEQTESIFMTDVEVKVGTNVVVPIILNHNPGIKDLTVKLSWNSNALTPVKATNGIIMNSTLFDSTNTDSSYTLAWTGTVDTTAKGNLAFVEFKVNSDAPLGRTSIKIQVLSASSKNGSVASSLSVGGCNVKIKDTNLKLSGATLSVSNDISVMFIVKKADLDALGYSDPYVIAKLDQQEEKLVPELITLSGALSYVFTFYNISPQRMSSEITTTLFALKGDEYVSSSSFMYSVCDYAYYHLENTDDPKFRKLLVDMLNYGEAAQQYTNYNLSDLANSFLSDDQKLQGTSGLRELNNITSVINKSDTDKAKWTGISLLVKNNISIYASFTADNTKGLFVKVKDANDKLITTIASSEFIFENNTVKFVFDELGATNLSDAYYFTIYNSKGEVVSGTCVYSVESYIHYSQSDANKDEKLRVLTQTILKYGDSAKDYVTGHTTPFTKLEPVYIGTSFFANISYQGKYLNVSGTNVDIRTPSSSANQYWRFNYQNDGSYEIINMSNNQALDVYTALDEDFTNVQTYSPNDTKAQRWFIYLIDGQYVFRPANSETRVLDVYSASNADGTNVDIYQFNNTAAQKFSVENMMADTVMYYVTSPYNEASKRIGTFTNLNEAIALANSKSFLGYVVYTSFGKLVHNPTATLNTAKIVWHSKEVCDFARDNGFSYGDAKINPAINWGSLNPAAAINPNERLIACDRLVDLVLYRAGYTNQKYEQGYVVYNLDEWLAANGFYRISGVSTLRAGDIIFTRWDPTKPGNAAHVFICASSNHGGNYYYRYDAGSNARIWCRHGNEYAPGQQPYFEPITQFSYAYRPY